MQPSVANPPGSSTKLAIDQPPAPTPNPSAQPGQAPAIGTRPPASTLLAATDDALRSRFCELAREGDATAIKRMILAGQGKLTTCDPATGATALLLAAQHGHNEVLVLLCKGASEKDIHHTNAAGDAALTLAAQHGHVDVLEFLLIKVPPLSLQNQALAVAAASGQVATINLLLARGVRADLPDELGTTPLHKAAANGHEAVVATLIKAGANVDDANAQGDTALILAARAGKADIVCSLLLSSAQADKRNASGENALSAATKAGHGEVARLLGPVTPPASGDDALARAASGGDLSAVQALLEGGADVRQTDDGGWTPLFHAAHLGHEAIVKLLLAHGADTGHLDRNGETALMLAVSAGQFSSAQALVDAGADVAIRNPQGKSAAGMARDMGHSLLAVALESRAAKPMTTVTSAATPAATTITTTTITTTTTKTNKTKGGWW